MDSGAVARIVAAFEAGKTANDYVETYVQAVQPYGGIGFTAADFWVEDRARLILYTSRPDVFTPLDRDSPWWADDPVVAQLSTGGLRPFDVNVAWSKPLPSAAQRWEILTEMGLHRGWVFPTAKPGFIGGVHLIADPDDHLRMADHLDTLHLFATYLHAFMTELDPDENGGVVVRNTLHRLKEGDRTVVLSPREVTCLRWCAFGKSAEDIALIEGISAHTVREYLRCGMRKLDSRTQAQAVARALKYGVFQI